MVQKLRYDAKATIQKLYEMKLDDKINAAKWNRMGAFNA